jgi:hypothetical protein
MNCLTDQIKNKVTLAFAKGNFITLGKLLYERTVFLKDLSHIRYRFHLRLMLPRYQGTFKGQKITFSWNRNIRKKIEKENTVVGNPCFR